MNTDKYDENGNLKAFGGYTMQYDVENRQVAMNGGTTATYSYDGEGRGVMKVVGGTTTVYVYDAAGELAAEHGATTPAPPAKTCCLVTDALGSTRMVPNLIRNRTGHLSSSWVSSGVGVDAEGFLFTQGGGGGVYANITTHGACKKGR
jgi:hypothetical protein